jgi:hypothetical protein
MCPSLSFFPFFLNKKSFSFLPFFLILSFPFKRIKKNPAWTLFNLLFGASEERKGLFLEGRIPARRTVLGMGGPWLLILMVIEARLMGGGGGGRMGTGVGGMGGVRGVGGGVGRVGRVGGVGGVGTLLSLIIVALIGIRFLRVTVTISSSPSITPGRRERGPSMRGGMGGMGGMIILVGMMMVSSPGIGMPKVILAWRRMTGGGGGGGRLVGGLVLIRLGTIVISSPVSSSLLALVEGSRRVSMMRGRGRGRKGGGGR